MTLYIRPFQPADQTIAKDLILAGLGERWGAIDYALNPDLNDIQANYVDPGHLFFVSEIEQQVMGTGCLMLEDEGIGRIVRMSISSDYRGKGFGRELTTHLINIAHERQLKTVLIETEYNWESAVQLYKTAGFIETHRNDTEQHFQLVLRGSSSPTLKSPEKY